MMTTGYDCQDLLNIALMRPVFSPTDFVQIKGRGTRKWKFEYDDYKNEAIIVEKTKFKFFDFFATCEYFEKEFNYDEKIALPTVITTTTNKTTRGGNVVIDYPVPTGYDEVHIDRPDQYLAPTETPDFISRMDKEGFKRAVKEDVVENDELKNMWENGDVQGAEEFAIKEVFNKPKYYLNLDRVRRLFNIDRRITVKEFLQYAFGERKEFEMKDDLLESEWTKFVGAYHVDQDHYQKAKNFFKAYISDKEVREVVDSREYARLNNCKSFDFEDFALLNDEYREKIPQYVNDYAYHLTNL